MALGAYLIFKPEAYKNEMERIGHLFGEWPLWMLRKSPDHYAKQVLPTETFEEVRHNFAPVCSAASFVMNGHLNWSSISTW